MRNGKSSLSMRCKQGLGQTGEEAQKLLTFFCAPAPLTCDSRFTLTSVVFSSIRLNNNCCGSDKQRNRHFIRKPKRTKDMPPAHTLIHLCCVRNYDIPPFPNEEGEEQLCKTKYA